MTMPQDPHQSGPQQQPATFPNPDQPWPAANPQQQPPPQAWQHQPLPQDWQQQPAAPWAAQPAPPPSGGSRPWWLALISAAVVVVVGGAVWLAVSLLTRPADDPVERPTATGTTVPLETDATLAIAQPGLSFDPPAGFFLADDDPLNPRWDTGPTCYLGLTQYEVEGSGTDVETTTAAQQDTVAYYESERLDAELLTDNGSVTVLADDGSALEFQVMELQFRREPDGPLLWTAFVTRQMPQTGWTLEINYMCAVGEEAPSLQEMIDRTLILTGG